MKKLLLITILISLTIHVGGQTWAPAGAKWTFGIEHVFGPQIEYREWICVGDTLVGGHVCKLIKRNGAYISGDISDKLITYEEGNIIYWYNINQFTILYDFNKNAGDTWTIMTDTCSLLITVDSTGIDIINGFPLKALYISSESWAFNGKILEHIGHVVRPNPNIVSHCYGIIEDANYYTGLRCYEDSVFGFHNFNIAPSCHYINTGIDELENPFRLTIFPNPATNNLTIQSTFAKQLFYKVFNLFGQIIKTGILQRGANTISVESLPNGVYVLELSADNKFQRQCFIVKK